MSSIVLLQDWDGKKKGDTISVPFFVGKTLLAKGVGEYLDKGKKPSPDASKGPSEMELLHRQNEQLRKQLEDSQAQLKKVIDDAGPQHESKPKKN